MNEPIGEHAHKLERDAIVAMMMEQALIKLPPDAMPTRKAVLWALIHPIKWSRELGRFYALLDALNAIERGEHLGKCD